MTRGRRNRLCDMRIDVAQEFLDRFAKMLIVW
jgi:hypothetical protein